MPGIAGIISKGGSQSYREEAAKMVACMKHEDYHAAGNVEIPDLGFYGGWTTHAGSFSDCLPIWNEKRDICLLFGGVHFGDTTEVQQLRASGHAVSDKVTAAYLVHLYEDLGEGFFPYLNGTFQGLIVDRRTKSIILFNDRFGLARLYFHESRDAIFFASEAKALLRVVPELRSLDYTGIAEQIVAGCTLRNRSFFNGISILPPGSAWSYRDSTGLTRKTYFSITAWDALPPLPAEDYYKELSETFTRILPKYFQGTQSIALSITGGLDSRMIVAGVNGGRRHLPCYTFGGMFRECEDVKIGRKVATICAQPHQVIRIDDSFFPKYLEAARKSIYISDGCMDATGAVAIHACQVARDAGTVRMTGNYGSEILRQNVAFRASGHLAYAFGQDFRPLLASGLATYQDERMNCSPLAFICTKQVPWHHYSRYSLENSVLENRSPYLDNELVQLSFRAPKGLLLNKQLAYRYTRDLCPNLKDASTDRGGYDKPRLVPKKLFEIAKEIIPRLEYYYDYGMPHWLARLDRSLSFLHLERRFLGHQKFDHFRLWFRHALSSQIKDVLLDPKSLGRSYLERDTLQKIVLEHTSGRGNHTLALHRLISLEFLHRELLDA